MHFFYFSFHFRDFQDMFLGMGQIPVIHYKFWKFCAGDVDIFLTFFIDWGDYKFLLTLTRDFNISSQITGIFYHSSSIYFCNWWHSISSYPCSRQGTVNLFAFNVKTRGTKNCFDRSVQKLKTIFACDIYKLPYGRIYDHECIVHLMSLFSSHDTLFNYVTISVTHCR